MDVFSLRGCSPKAPGKVRLPGRHRRSKQIKLSLATGQLKFTRSFSAKRKNVTLGLLTGYERHCGMYGVRKRSRSWSRWKEELNLRIVVGLRFVRMVVGIDCCANFLCVKEQISRFQVFNRNSWIALT